MKNKIYFRGKSYDVLDSRIDGNVILYKIKYRKVDTWVNNPTETVLITPTEEANGLVAVQDSFNDAIWNVRKVSLSGRDNGLVGRWNTVTQSLNFDGSSHRTYVPFEHGRVAGLETLCAQLI